jgi:hypothetical protein
LDNLHVKLMLNPWKNANFEINKFFFIHFDFVFEKMKIIIFYRIPLKIIYTLLLICQIFFLFFDLRKWYSPYFILLFNIISPWSLLSMVVSYSIIILSIAFSYIPISTFLGACFLCLSLFCKYPLLAKWALFILNL